MEVRQQRTILMAEMSDSVGTIDLEDVAATEFGALLADEGARRGVLIFEVAGLRGGDEEVMVRKEGETIRLDVIFQFAEKERRRRKPCRS